MNGISSAYVLTHDLDSYQALTAPKKPPATVVNRARKPFDHVVARKETPGALAERFGTTVAELMKDNPAIKDPAKIYVGQIVGIYGQPSGGHATVTGRAIPSKPKPMPAANASSTPTGSAKATLAAASTAASADLTRSKEGTGQPLAIVPADQKTAPWMPVAIAEARKWVGKKENVITKTSNFHERMGMSGDMVHTPWCAAFANYCLMTGKAPYEKSASSQFPTWSKKFKKISKPVYGALMVMRNYDRDTGKFHGSGHVTFVYGATKEGSIAGLGGNQGDRLKVSEYQSTGVSARFTLKGGTRLEQRFHAFYVPVTYEEYAKSQGELEIVDVDDVNRNFLNIAVAAFGTNEKTQ